MLVSIAFATTAQAQTEQRLSIDEMFRMIDQRNSSIKADRYERLRRPTHMSKT